MLSFLDVLVICIVCYLIIYIILIKWVIFMKIY